MKKTIVPFLNILFALALISCNSNDKAANRESNGKDNIVSKSTEIREDNMDVLNDRQIEICTERGIPTEIDNMTEKQKKNIFRIEELLVYLEEKYDTEFFFLEYFEKSVDNDEQLLAYTDDTSIFDYTTLTIVDFDEFKDDYIFQSYKNTIRIDLWEYFTNIFKSKIFISSGFSDAEHGNDSNIEELKNNTRVSFVVFVLNSEAPSEEELRDKMSNWYIDRGIYGTTSFFVVDSETFEKVNDDNYSDILRDNRLETYVTADITKDMEIKGE